MTNLYDGRIADLLQQNTAQENPEILALSHAILTEKRRIIDHAQRTRTIAMIDLLPEDILDVLAVELRTPYYSGDMPLEQKRTLIKNTLKWFFKAGTPAAVRELIAAVFGQGDIVEWFDFTEPPYTPGTFDIVTDARMTEDIADRFLQIIKQVKNTRSHLRRVLVERKGDMQVYVGSGATGHPEIPVVANAGDQDASGTGRQTIKAGTISEPRAAITNTAQPRSRTASGPATAKAGAAAAPATTIVNHAPARAQTAHGAARFGAVLVVATIHRIITNCPPPGTLQIGHPQTAHAAASAYSKISIT